LEIDLGDAVLPPMAFGEGKFAGGPLRVARVSFTGDRSYELSIPASMAASLAALLEEKARALGGGWMGLEALSLLRAEKGYIIVGKDTEGSTMPHDLGVGGPRESRKDEYIGKRGLFMPVAEDADRRQLVGLSVDDAEPLPTGAHAVEGVAGARRSLGYVTSSYFSPTLIRPIALALIAGGFKRMGENLTFWHLGAERRARVVSPVALDPEGARLHA
jgi:sarcosine oxidase subunit alpha